MPCATAKGSAKTGFGVSGDQVNADLTGPCFANGFGNGGLRSLGVDAFWLWWWRSSYSDFAINSTPVMSFSAT